jgi:hypothetical protein
MKNIGITNPCSENWNEMSKNEQGAFCQKCASQVYDFTNKSSLEIKQTLLSLVGQPVCGRITNKQEMELNEEFNRWMNRQNRQSFQSQLLFALLIVFGLGLFSCENQKDEENLKEIQTSVARIISESKLTEKSSYMSPAPAMDHGQIQFSPPATLGEISVEKDLESTEQFDTVGIGKISAEEIFDKKEEYTIEGGMSYTDYYEVFLAEEINSRKPVDSENDLINKSRAMVFPNPAKEQTSFEFDVRKKAIYEIALFDMNGKLIETIQNGELKKGKFRHELNLINLNPGLYLLVINSDDFKETVKFSKI